MVYTRASETSSSRQAPQRGVLSVLTSYLNLYPVRLNGSHIVCRTEEDL